MKKRSGIAGLTVALALALIAVAQSAAALPRWLQLPEGVSSYSGEIDGLFRLILWITGVIFVLLALLSKAAWAEIKQRMPANALQVEVTGEQFAWNIRYPGPDGKFGTADDIVSLNQLHFPVGRPVVATLRSKDVIHSFFLPEFRVKQDAVPGMTSRIWFDAT